MGKLYRKVSIPPLSVGAQIVMKAVLTFNVPYYNKQINRHTLMEYAIATLLATSVGV